MIARCGGSPQLTTLLKTFPHTHYHAQWKLMTWHPVGLLDDALADEIIGVIESKERSDWAGVTKKTRPWPAAHNISPFIAIAPRAAFLKLSGDACKSLLRGSLWRGCLRG
jgi:hypothetical protein